MYGEAIRLDMMVSNKNKRISFDLYFDENFAKERTSEILNYAWEMYKVVEGDNMFLIHHDFNESYHYAINNIIQPPGGMGIFWAVVNRKLSYEKYLDKSALLSMPAYKVEELEDDAVFIQYYEDPWEYDTPAAIDFQRNCVNHIIEHLNSDWDAWKKNMGW